LLPTAMVIQQEYAQNQGFEHDVQESGMAEARLTRNALSTIEDLQAIYIAKSEPHVGADVDTKSWGSARLLVHNILNFNVLGASAFDLVMATVVLINVIVMAVESDLSADCVMSSHHCASPEWLNIMNIVFLTCYTLECAIRLFVQRKAYFCEPWNYLDTLVVLLGFVQLSVEGEGVRQVNMLRLFRIARIVRVLKVLRWVPALWSMISGLIGALQAMSWGLILVVLLLLIWSIISVEVIHPIAWRVHNQPDPQSEWCREAFSTVLKATLYFFVTLVAGDGWAVCAVPIIEDSPMAWSVFAVSLVTIQLGFLNLVLAVIVDNAAEARDASKEEKAAAQKELQAQSFIKWADVMTRLDADKSGTIHLDELMLGYSDKTVKAMLDDMCIDRSDLEMLFKLMDADDSGELEYTEFIHALMKAQTQDPKVYTMTMQLRLKKIEFLLTERLENHFSEIDRKLEAYLGKAGGHTTVFAPAPTKVDAPIAPTAMREPEGAAVLVAELHTFACQIDRRLAEVEASAAEAAAVQARVSLEVAASVLGALRGASTTPPPGPAMFMKKAVDAVEQSPSKMKGDAGDASDTVQPLTMRIARGGEVHGDPAMAVVEALGAAAATATALLAGCAQSKQDSKWEPITQV